MFMKKLFLPVVLFVCTMTVFAEDFKWSWDGELDAPPVSEETKNDDGGIVPVEETPQNPAENDAGEEGLEKAYRKLLDDNLELRRKITEAEKQADAIRGENRKLTGEIRDLEKRIEESVKLIQSLKLEQGKAGVS